ncbi:MAG: TolC family protein [Gemmatimonadaceae bacterium]|nr:TolC family protein [Gemmatimonadaceae bacterium]
MSELFRRPACPGRPVRALLRWSVLCALPAALSAQAPAASPRRIDFADAVKIALQQNITLQQAENARAQSAVTVQQQRNQFLPNFNFNTNTSGNNGQSFNQTAGRLVNQTSQTLNLGVTSNVTVFNGFQNLSLLKQARFSESASVAEVARARQTVVFTVASNFLSLVTLQEQLAVQVENQVAQQAQLDQVDLLVKAGRRSIADQYQQQAAVAAAQSAVVTAKRALELSKVDLIQTLQLDPGVVYDFTPPAVDTSAAAPTFTLDGLLASAIRSRVDLRAAETRVEAADEALRTSGSTRWPSIAMSFGYNSGYTSLTDESFSQQLNQRRGGSVGLSLAIPIFDRGAARVVSEQAAINVANAKLTSERQRQTVALEVRRAFLDYEAALEQLNATRAQQRASDLALQATQERYRVGAATLVELSVARATQVSAASALVNARYNLIFQQSLMSYYTGTLDPARVSFGRA